MAGETREPVKKRPNPFTEDDFLIYNKPELNQALASSQCKNVRPLGSQGKPCS